MQNDKTAIRTELILAILLSSLVGCAADTSQHTSALADRHDKALSLCKTMLQEKKFASRVDYANCITKANKDWWYSSNAPNPELVELAAARDLALAEKFDKGQLSELEYNEGRAKIRADLFAEANHRSTNQALVNAATSQASSAAVQAQNSSRPVTCTGSGTTITCF